MIVTAWGRQITVNTPITVPGTAPAGDRARTRSTARDRGTGDPPAPPASGAAGRAPAGGAVTDLRRRAGRSPRQLHFAAGDLVVVSGLPGSGKSTLMRRAVPGARIDSQDMRDHWAGRLPRSLPYGIYRPLVRLAHYLRLRRLLRTGTGLVVHDCGMQAWVRHWLAREAARRHATLHLLLLDVAPETALAGQGARGRRVSRYAFLRHRRAVARLVRGLTAGRLPTGCASAVLLDRPAADTLRTIAFRAGGPDPSR
jgi:predicted kinase